MPQYLPRAPFARAILAAGLAAVPLAAPAIDWRCELVAGATRLACRADALRGVHDGSLAPAAEPVTTAVVNGTRFPLDAAQPWFVELWSPATEMDRVEQLARATICYRSPGCTVSVVLPQRWASK